MVMAKRHTRIGPHHAPAGRFTGKRKKSSAGRRRHSSKKQRRAKRYSHVIKY